MPNTYTYTDLKDASGTVNVIAVVKYHRPPVRSRGSGYSLLVSVTDPSLNGAKLQCIFFDDSVEKLPQVRAPGDVMVMHRLVVKKYRNQTHGYGYGNVGFAAAIFSGLVSDRLEPRSPNTACSFGDSELNRVRFLRGWFNSPACPVEHEPHHNREFDDSALHVMPSQCANNSRPPVTRLWDLRADQFANTEGQIVGIYSYPKDDRCIVLYLWDGPPPPHSEDPTSLPIFLGPPKEHLCQLLPSADIDPHLASITAHRLSSITDWSVPIFFYDEHISSLLVARLKCGDVVRITNLHVRTCRTTECSERGCLRLIVHGGGRTYGRGLEVLKRSGQCDLFSEDEHTRISPELTTRLRQGLVSRPLFLKVIPQTPLPLLTILQICSIPWACHQTAAENFNLPFSPPAVPTTLAIVPQSSWISVPGGRGSSVLVRLTARVLNVYPSTSEELVNMLVVACNRCQSAIRLSSLVGQDEELCACEWRNREEQTHVFCPFVFLLLEDSTGRLMISSHSQSALGLLMHSIREEERPSIWEGLAEEWFRGVEEKSITSELLSQLSELENKFIDIVLKISWRTEWDLGAPEAPENLDLKFSLVNGSTIYSEQET